MSAGGVIATRAELEARLAALPPPASGKLRVFRGQTQRYPKLLASGNRGSPSPREQAWLVHSQLMALALREAELATPDAAYADLDDFLFWLQALKQHYGPGSPFIDVTHALDVALWFALNQAHTATKFTTAGTGQTPGVDVFPIQRRWLYFERVCEPGWLYVLDVTRPSERLAYEHGSFVDLRVDAPEVYRASTRIQAQHACLVYGDRDVDGGDLSSLCACEPLAIAPELLDELTPPRDTRAIFPAPDDDPWYARFLEVPHAWDLDGDDKLPAYLAPALDVTLYTPAAKVDARELEGFRSRFLVPLTPLVLGEFARDEGATPELRGALGVLLEGPITAATPPLATGGWNEEALWRGIDDLAWLRVRHDEARSRLVSASNVFFEFSPLEIADWPAYAADSAREFVRGVWLRTVGDARELWIANERLGSPVELFGGVRIGLDRTRRRIVVLREREPESAPLLAEAPFAKHVFCALLVLHHLSPRPKVGPFAWGVFDDVKNVVVQQGAVARFESVPLRTAAAGYVRVRNAVDGSVYVGGGASEQHREALVDAPDGLGALPYERLARLFA